MLQKIKTSIENIEKIQETIRIGQLHIKQN